jgi:hypothetical protein
MHPEGPARPSRHRFSWFSSVFKQMLRWFLNSKLQLHASHAALPILNSSKLPPVLDASDLTVFQIIDKTIRNSKFRCLPEATAITITSSLSHYSYQKDEQA